MHALPDRLHARRRGDRPYHPGAGPQRQPDAAARPVRYDDPRLAVRTGRSDPAAGAERAEAFPRRLRPGGDFSRIALILNLKWYRRPGLSQTRARLWLPPRYF